MQTIWNWQQKDWPIFSFDQAKLKTLEEEFLQKSGTLFGAFKYIDEKQQENLKIEFISREALNTSEIEGEFLDRDSIQSSIRRNFGLEKSNLKESQKEKNISQMMFDIYQNFDKNLTHKDLFSWHKDLFNQDKYLKEIGKYRTHSEPMQIVSGRIHDPKIHFEAIPSINVKIEMTNFIDWFNKASQDLSPLVRCAISHLYFLSIHPFSDGNGRIARAIAIKSLSGYLKSPTLIALSTVISKNKKDYYKTLEKSSKNNQITNWIIYFSRTVILALDYTQKQIDFLIEKGKFYQKFQNQLNKRQEKVINRLFKEGVDSFEGGLSASNYLSISKSSKATTTRDLQDLVEKGILYKKGELKYSRYFLKF